MCGLGVSAAGIVFLASLLYVKQPLGVKLENDIAGISDGPRTNMFQALYTRLFLTNWKTYRKIAWGPPIHLPLGSFACLGPFHF